MPSSLRARIALFTLMALFLIPIGMSSLRGLTHILTCSQRAETPFTITIPTSGPPEITSSTKITEGDQGLCGGLTLDMLAGGDESGKIRMVVSITNNTHQPWRGTVGLLLQGTPSVSIPVNIGDIQPSETESDEIVFKKLPRGTHELNGTLLIGP